MTTKTIEQMLYECREVIAVEMKRKAALKRELAAAQARIAELEKARDEWIRFCSRTIDAIDMELAQ